MKTDILPSRRQAIAATATLGIGATIMALVGCTQQTTPGTAPQLTVSDLAAKVNAIVQGFTVALADRRANH